MAKKSNGIIEAALREHSNSRIKRVGNPKITVGAFIGMVAVATGLSFVNVTANGADAGSSIVSFGSAAKAAPLDLGSFTLPSMSISEPGATLKKDAEQRPAARYMTHEFFSIAADAIRHNSGVSLEEAENSLDALEDAGQLCKTAGNRKAKCTFSFHGADLDFGKEVYTVTYDRYSKDGKIDLGDRVVGAVQQGNEVVVRADPHNRTFAVPEQGR